MSLEQALAENTAAVRELIAALKNSPLPVSFEQPAAKPEKVAPAQEKPKAEAAKKPVEQAAVTEPAATQPTAETSAAPESKANESAPEITAEDMQNAFRAYMAANGRDAAVALLDSFGVKKLGELPAAKHADFMKKAA